LGAAPGEVERVQPFDLARDLPQQADERQAPAEFGDGEVEAHVEHCQFLVALLSDDDVTGVEDVVDLAAQRPPLLVRSITGVEFGSPFGPRFAVAASRTVRISNRSSASSTGE